MLLNLRTELRETEHAHREATVELERMKETMERMELERAEMIAEVEMQIERALASMAVDIDESDYSSSRPQSRLSNLSGAPRSRRPSDAFKNKALRSFATDSTLAETYGDDDTIWFVHGVLELTSQLDPNLPYIITGENQALWMCYL